MDKKLYTYDSGSKRFSSCISYEAPFSSLAFGDNGHILAAGTGNGRVVFYDVRKTPQPVTVLHAFSSSEVSTFLTQCNLFSPLNKKLWITKANEAFTLLIHRL